MPRLTDADLQAIRARADAATHGPWAYDGQHYEITTPFGDSYWLIASECRATPEQEVKPDQFGHEYNADYAFIAHARQDVPALLDEIAALQARNAELDAGLQWALDEGGWRLLYYAAPPVQYIIEVPMATGEHGKVRPEAKEVR